MKKIYILFAALSIVCMHLSAQISITSDELLGVGDIVVQAFDEDPDPSILPGDAGEDIIWDFSALQEDNTDTFRFMSPTSTPYWGNFPTANLALFTGTDSSYAYFNKNTQNLKMVGVATEVEELGLVSSTIEPNELFLVFPYEYGFQDNEVFDYYFESSVTTPGVDSMKVRRNTVKDSHVDAWGSMTVPMGTYDVLRVHETRDYIDSIWAKVPFFGWQLFAVEEDTEERYLWWSDDPEVGYVLINLNIDPESGEVMSSEFMAEPHLVGMPEQKSTAHISVYPNPVQDNVIISNTGDTEMRYAVYDLNGKKLMAGISNPVEKTILDLEGLESGIYFLRMKEGDEFYTTKLVKR